MEHSGSAQYQASVRATMDLVDRISVPDWSRPGVCGDWTLKDLLGHLAFWDEDLAEDLEAKRDGRTLPVPGEDEWRQINTEQAAIRANWLESEILDELRAAQKRLIPLLDHPGEDPDDEPISAHWEEHRAEIEAWLAAKDHWQPREDDLPEVSHDAYNIFSSPVLEIVEEIPRHLREEPGVCGEWSLKDLMGHLAYWDGVVADGLEARKKGTGREADSRTYDEINADAYAQRKDRAWDEILAEVVSNQARLIPLLLDPGELGDYKIFMHWREHGELIEAWVAQHGHV